MCDESTGNVPPFPTMPQSSPRAMREIGIIDRFSVAFVSEGVHAMLL